MVLGTESGVITMPVHIIRVTHGLMMVLLATVLAGAEVAATPLAGEHTVVVINGTSAASAQVARAWMRRRGVADDRAVVLEGVPLAQRMPLADFRRLILAPLEAALVRQGRAESTLLVAYGPDFPTAITFDDAGMPDGFRSPGSLTGLTTLAPLLDAGPRAFTAPQANPYGEQLQLPGQRESMRAIADARMQRGDQLLREKDYATAETLLGELARDIPAPVVLYNLACVQALAGRTAEAFATLGKAVDAGWFDDRHSSKDTDLARLWTEPGWPALVRRMQEQALQIQPAASIPFALVPARGGSPPGRLAIMLGVTSGRGLTVEETIANLERSITADGTRPRGAVWFMASSDEARTGPRRWAFPAAATILRSLGVQAEVRDGILPPRGAEVVGATIGIADFDWAANGAPMQPGAWCDHLTSFGGVLEAGAGQTPLTAFLRAGAAGAGGTVAEPLNYPFKFPSAFIHVHRARGLSLVEAVYRTTSCPYQYLVVGDPLSRPWPTAAAP